ncbi:uncharacterized protein METZ01_LOCUS66970 [marine metagenome]|uniref:Membrane transporter protein n=1 Tax=marine metagenome TaxID=408172 RepID=A0A381TDA3_9ZZZZ
MLPLLFFFVALIYSSIGLGGGSSYIALMTIVGISYQTIPATSLILNLVVTFIGMISFWYSGHGRFDLVVPLLIISIPMAYFGGLLTFSENIFQIILLTTLIIVAIRIYIFQHLRIRFKVSGTKKFIFIIVIGSVLGFIAGSVGIGGGIYLVPLIIMFGLGSEKEAAATGATFIWFNSLAGVIARLQSGTIDTDFILPLTGAVMVGGFTGSYLGAVRYNAKTIQNVMGFVVIIAIVVLSRDIL